MNKRKNEDSDYYGYTDNNASNPAQNEDIMNGITFRKKKRTKPKIVRKKSKRK